MFDPPRRLEYTWGEETTRWELSPDGEGGCRLVFTDVFDADLDQPGHRDATAQAGASWHACLDVLDARLAGREIDWSAWDRAAELQEGYATAVAAGATSSTSSWTVEVRWNTATYSVALILREPQGDA